MQFFDRISTISFTYFKRDHSQGLRRMERAYTEANIESTQSEESDGSDEGKNTVEDSEGNSQWKISIYFGILLRLLYTYISSQKWDSGKILNISQWDKYLKKINRMEDGIVRTLIFSQRIVKNNSSYKIIRVLFFFLYEISWLIFLNTYEFCFNFEIFISQFFHGYSFVAVGLMINIW